ncbi:MULTISPECIES: hypothetical protein [unclassified Tatumella]|uniref:hypothetical protein n=1 Tax=unclassified Tatumella TaxID=2649542 RepID=UPI001BB00751|nr:MULTISPECIES: hypothetical protein [unclassified Tatumella]MBS0854933.1 hypothetical protein [Tatumella sp. JGM16]MBS0912105.1 hypothetical protein [Tatumella sp. JGM91]
MAFPSPANDYIEARLTPNLVMGITESSIIIPTDEGYAVVEPGIPAKAGRVVLLDLAGQSKMFATVGAGRFITDGGIIEGDALDDTRVIGVVTFMVKDIARGVG